MDKVNKVRWNLEDIESVKEFEKRLKAADEESMEMAEWLEKLEPGMEEKMFGKFIDDDEDLSERISRLAYLPELLLAEDQKNNQARLMETRVNDLVLKHNRVARKIGHWLKGLPVEGKDRLDDKNAKRLFGSVPKLEYVLNYARKTAKYTLSQKEEEVIDNKDVNGMGVVANLRELIEGEMIFEMGKRKIKTQAELLKYTRDKSSKKRRAAYRSLLDKHKKHIDKLFLIYQGIVKDWDWEARVRGYKSPIAMRNFANQINDGAVEKMLEAVEKNRDVFRRYFKYKAKMLKKAKLDRCDIYAPMKGVRAKKYSFEESKKMVLKSFAEFSRRFEMEAKKIFDEGHIDAYPRKNKRSGAFCATVCPKVTPYIMLNHTESLRDVSTLAHELGHAIHSLMARDQRMGGQQASLPLAETASTLAELLLFEMMLAEEKDVKVKKVMLWEKIGESYATILRQADFVRFEIEAHQMIVKGTMAKMLSEKYLEILRKQLDRAVKVDAMFKYEWLYISHIFESPFYCYAYCFGELLSLSLLAKFKKDKSFAGKIEDILRGGGSEDPEKILEKAGIDIKNRDFWQGGFEVILEWQSQLDKV